MSKYGPGVSMREVILNERKMIRETLTRSKGLSLNERQAILDAFEEMAYQWCQANAMCCTISDAFENRFGKISLQAAMILGQESAKKFRETYPTEEEEDGKL